jgi:hypothetical protein
MTAQNEPSIAQIVLDALTTLRTHIDATTKQRDAAIRCNEALTREVRQLQDDNAALTKAQRALDRALADTQRHTTDDRPLVETLARAVSEWWVLHDLSRPVHPACVAELLDHVVTALGVDRRLYVNVLNAKLRALYTQHAANSDNDQATPDEHVRQLFARMTKHG